MEILDNLEVECLEEILDNLEVECPEEILDHLEVECLEETLDSLEVDSLVEDPLDLLDLVILEVELLEDNPRIKIQTLITIWTPIWRCGKP